MTACIHYWNDLSYGAFIVIFFIEFSAVRWYNISIFIAVAILRKEQQTMKWSIVSDSSCDLMEKDIACEEIGFKTVPFSLRIGEKEYIDDEALDVLDMVNAMEACSSVSRSSCPSPEAWAHEFEKAENIVAITISANLSGSFNSAIAAKNMVLDVSTKKQIGILNSKSTGPEIALCIKHIAEWIKSGNPIETVMEKAEAFLKKCKTSFALCSFDNLVKNGRMKKTVGFIAKKLGMWGIGIASDEGTITIKGKSRGAGKVISFLLEDMKERGFNGGEVAISHCFNGDMAQRLKKGILECWSNAKVSILKTRGLDCFYAERGGLIIAFC